MSARQRPRAVNRASSRIVATHSSRARSMKAHVLTTRHSASSGRSASGNPASVSMPSMSSESTWFLGQPSVVRWTFMLGTSVYPGSSEGASTAPIMLRGDPRRSPLKLPCSRLERAAGSLASAVRPPPKPALERRLLRRAPGIGLRLDRRLDHVGPIPGVPVVHHDEDRYQVVSDVRQPLVVTDEEPEGASRRRRLFDVERGEREPVLVRPVA